MAFDKIPSKIQDMGNTACPVDELVSHPGFHTAGTVRNGRSWGILPLFMYGNYRELCSDQPLLSSRAEKNMAWLPCREMVDDVCPDACYLSSDF